MGKFVSGPTIAALTQTPRMTINDRLRAGSFGPTYKCDRIVYVGLDRVEKYFGINLHGRTARVRFAWPAGSHRHNQ